MSKLFVQHTLGDFNKETLTQSCILCGEKIEDYSKSMWPAGQDPPKGWSSGLFYIKKGNPTQKQSVMPGIYVKCNEIAYDIPNSQSNTHYH